MQFNTYPVTANMGLRESIDAMLAHVAYNGHPFGYLPSAVHQANFYRLFEDFSEIVEESDDTLRLRPVIRDSGALNLLVENLVTLCNDYPAYDDEKVSQIEYDRLIEVIEERSFPNSIDAHDIARELFDLGAVIEQNEYGANVSEYDFELAVESALSA